MSDGLLQTIEQNLQAAKPSGSVPLDATTLTAAGAAIVELISERLGSSVAFAGDASIALDGGVLSVTGAGTATLLGIQSPALAASLTTTPATGGGDVLQLVLTVQGSGWSLATTFPNLAAATSLGALTFAGPTFVLRSADGPKDEYGVLEPAGLSLEASVTVADVAPLSALDPILTLSQGSLALSGPVSVTSAAEAILLRTAPGSASTAPLTVAGVASFTLSRAAVVLRGSASKVDDGTWKGAADAEVWGTAPLGDGDVVLSITPPLGVAPWAFGVVPGLGVPLSRLLGVVPGLSVVQALPDGVQQAVNGEVTAFSFLLSAENGGWTPVALSVGVQTATPWTIVQGVIDLRRLAVALDVGFDGGPSVKSGTVSGAIELGDAIEIDASVPIPLGGGVISVWSSPNVALPGLGALARLVGGADFAAGLPSGFADVGAFRLTSLAATIGTSPLALQSVGIGLGSDPWTIIDGRLVIDGVWADVTVANPLSSPVVTGSIAGTVTFGTGVQAPTLDVAVQRFSADADWLLVADVRNVELPTLSDFASLAGADPGSLLPSTLTGQSGMKFTLVDLGIEVDLTTRTLDLFHLEIAMSPWQIAPGYFAVEELSGALTIDWRSGSAVSYGFIQAVLVFGDGAAQLVLRGERAQDGGWTLSGTLTDDVDLIELVGKALGLTPPQELGKLTVSPLSLTYRTKDDSYDFNAAATWTPSIAAVQFELDAAVELHRTPIEGKTPAQFTYAGAISADLSAHFSSHALALSVGYVFQTQNSITSYVFGLKFDQLSLTGTYKKGANGDEIVTVHLGGVTFGGIVTYLVNLVDPDLHFSLSAPWDVLNKISFDNLSLTINLTQRSVGISYAAKLDLGLIDIETIGLTYLHKGGSPTVEIEFTGSFLGQKYTPDKPLGWDMLNESPPTPSGQGTQLFDLRLLGIGQHVVLADPHADTMAKVIDELGEVVKQTKGSPKPWELLKFDPSAGWLFAADFTVMDTLTLRLVFDDPVLYGVEIALAGEKAGPFAGLKFEILYRKLSDSLGVYHIALTLPDVMRHLEFGEVSVTLPDVVVDIYTDGSFYLDFGFPYNNDWTVCFGLQVFPFVGAGGFYFGKLSTAAAAGTDLVPKATNGTFGPVIEFGVALAIGVGKSISEGPLSAGVSVTVQGVVTGVVSWFNPTDAAQGSDQYHKIEGSVAVVGQLYGRVDFKIITIDISVVASATVSLAVESYQPILIGLSLDVEVHASIKIVFFTIHFSFGLHLDASFTIGSAQATPWHLAATDGGGTHARTSLAARRRAEHGHHVHAGARALLAAVAPRRDPLTWAPAPVMGGSQVLIDVELVPLFTPAANGAAAVKIVMAAFVQTSSAAGAAHDAWREAVGTGDRLASELPFNVIAEALLKWGMNTLIGQHSGPITAVDLQLIYEDLCRRDIGATGFAYGNVTAFLDENIQMTLVPPPAPAADVARTVLPMPPPLQMAAPDLAQPVKFWETPEVGADYQEELLRLADQLKVNFDYSRAHDPLAPDGDATSQGGDGAEPITEALFGDWFLMVTRSVVQSARSLLHEHDHELTEAHDDSLADLAARFAPSVQYTMRAGDTFASIAELFGITTTQLVDDPANQGKTIEPGTTLTVPPAIAEVEYVTVGGDTVKDLAAAWHTHTEAIEAANPGVDFDDLAAGTALRVPVREELLAIADANLEAKLAAVRIPISGLRYQVRASDTLGAIATAYGLPDADALAEANATDANVLQGGATLTIAQAGSTPLSIPYTTAAFDTLATLAAMLLVRNERSVEQAFGGDPSYNWLANAIPAYNDGVVFTDLGAGVELQIPNVVPGPKGLQPNDPAVVSYTTKAGDTLPLVAATFVMSELRPADPVLTGIETAIKALNPKVDWTSPLPVGTELELPSQAHQIAPGDTLGALAHRYWLTVRDLALVNSGAQVLSPTATVALPAGTPVDVTGLTVASLAAKLGLSADALVARIGARRGIFATPQKLKVQRAREYDVDDLLKRIVDSGEANSAAGQASSFLLQGLRAPDPGAPSKYRALYDLTAQQFTGPTAPQDYTITFTAPAPEKWLDLPGGQVAVAVTQNDMQQSWPATTLDPQIKPGYPIALPLGRAQPVRHPVGTPTPWAAPTPPTLSGPAPPAGGGPVLFPLPTSATSRAASDPTPHPYELATAPKGRQADPTPVPTYAWATWVPFTVRRVPAAGGGWIEGTYVVIGADQTGADTLLSLWTYLQSSGEQATLALAYQAASGTGLVSDALGAGTALLKVNLSTETHSPPAMLVALLRGTPAPATYAPLTQAQQFVQLLWEATITGTGGFYLTYDTATHGPLPDAAFASGDDAQLVLVALLDAQTQSTPDRTLHPFTTGALVEGNLDPSRFDIFAQATDGSDMTEVAVVPPGNVGYALERTNPSPVAGAAAADDPAEDLTRGLYSMLAFTLLGDRFDPPDLVFPTGPVKDSDPLAWHYDRTIPVFRLVKTPPAVLPAALPDAKEDPYAGVAAGSQVTLVFTFRDRFGNELGDVPGALGPIDIGYTDPVLGLSAWPGVTAAYSVGGPDGAAMLAVCADLALTKYVPSPGNLFAAAVRTAAAHRTTYKQIYFQLRRADVAATLATSLDAPGKPCLSSAELKPPLLGLVTAAYVYLGAAAAVGQAELPVRSSPAQTLAGQAEDLFVSTAQLAEANGAADASQLFSGSLTIPDLRVVRPSDTLATIAGGADLSVAALLDQNEDVPLSAGTVVQTAVRTYAAAQGDTLTSIGQLEDTTPPLLAVANSTTTGLLQPQTVKLGDFSFEITDQDTFATLATKLLAYDPTMTVPGAGQALANVATIFVPNKAIAIATSPVSPDDTTGERTCTVGEGGEALAAIAGRVGCTALGLALANGQRPGVLDPKASVDVEGVTVSVGTGGTILSVTLALRAQSLMVGIAEVTAAIQGRTDLLVPNAELAVVDHVVQKGETIASVAALSVPVLSLFAAAAPPNVFATGTALTVGSSQYRPQAGDTLAAIAAEGALTLDQLAAAIGGATLTPGAPVVVPGGMTAPTDAPVPHQVALDATSTPTIATVATTFGTTAAVLGTLNADMPGLLAAGIAIDYPGHPLTTNGSSTLASLAAEAGVAVDVFTADASVAGNTHLVAAGALFACPLPPVKGSLDDMATALGVLPLDLASANSALMGLVAPTHEFVVTVPTPSKPVIVTVTSGTDDTLQSLVRRVQAQAPTATLADLVASCGGDSGAVVQGVQILVPPAAVGVDAAIADPVHVATTFSPLDVTLTVARDPDLVDPEFATAADVAANATTIAPGLGDPPSIVPFAIAFEAAFATRRLKLATGPQSAGRTPQLWVVDFGAGGLSRVAVDGGSARFYAVTPISRTLAGGQASIRPYDPNTGKLGSPLQQTIASADLDSWMRIALGAIDLVLSPAVGAAAWRQEAACLNSLVASKQTIAGALRDRVAEILQDASPDADALAPAREALYQGMLVSLASAYTSDAVVTYPVTVRSPFTAPYATGPYDGFDALATAYGVSPEGVAQGLAGVPSILAQVTVSANGRPYAIVAGETLRTLATAIGVDVTALPTVVTVPANTPLFAANTTLAQSAMTRTVVAGDTFASLGAFFGTDPGSVGLAARLVPGLVPKDQTVTVDGADYVVKEGDTLTAIAAALSQAAGHEISVQAVAAAPKVVDEPTLLSANAVVYCFSPANLVAPRLSGKATTEQYRVQPGDGMDALVAWYEVSLEALADALAHAQILNAGTPGDPVTATWSGHSAPIAAGDTLTTLATTLGAPDVLTMLAGITIAPEGAGLLRPGITVALGRVTKTPSSSDSFASLAAYFEDDPGSFAVANQDRPGVLIGGTELKLGTSTYEVGDADTLVDVAKGLGTSPRELAVAEGIGDRTGIFTASPVYDLQVLPEFSLSTAKTPLADGTSHVAFLFGTNADASFKSLFLDVGYDVAEIETDIRNIPGAGDYQASEWLRLVVPLGATAFGGDVDLTAGQTQVPIPLRAFPLLPSVVDLAAEPAWPAPTTIAEAKQWELMAAVQHQSAAQDEIQLEVTFGSAPSLETGEASPALFNALAQFVTAWPEMQTDVAALAAMPAGVTTDKMRSLVESLATLAGDLATALTQPSQRPVGDPVAGQLYEFRLEPTIDHGADPPVLELFDLTVMSATEPDEVPWPTVYLSDAVRPLRRVPQPDGVMRYFYETGEKPPAFQSLTQRYVFPGDTPGRDAVAFQTGQVTAAVQRNADLVTTAKTAEAFLYQTPWVSFSAAAVPFLQTASPIAIGTGADLTGPLTKALTELLTFDGGESPAPGPYMVRILVTYERTLAGANGSGPITMSLPVVYVPQWSLAGDAIGTLAGDLAAQATQWSTVSAIQQHPGDTYVVDLSIFATADPAMTRPLVETSRLTIPLA